LKGVRVRFVVAPLVHQLCLTARRATTVRVARSQARDDVATEQKKLIDVGDFSLLLAQQLRASAKESRASSEIRGPTLSDLPTPAVLD
jgi:hypothetical protein